MAQRQWRSDDTDKWKHGFGKGGDGASYSAPANAGCSGTSGATALTLDAASTFANNDLVLIHQTRGTGAGSWELNKISSGGGTTSITLAHTLQNTYTDSGNSQAQIIELKEYENLTTTGNITVPAWDGNKGGIVAFLDKGTFTLSHTISGNGANGKSAAGQANPSNGGGFRGGYGNRGNTSNVQRGEGHTAAASTGTTANGNGGGGGTGDDHQGGSGGHANNGVAGSGGGGGGGANGSAGGTAGNAGLTTMVFGGGGGGGGEYDGGARCSSGANGGAIVAIFAQEINISGGSITVNGGNSVHDGDDGKGTGAPGAGGSILLKGATITLGTNKATASGGSDSALSYSRTGSVGRIHIDYSGSYTGTTSPTIDATLDTTIKPAGSGEFFAFF